MKTGPHAGVYVIANAAEVGRLRVAAAAGHCGAFDCIALDPAAPLPAEVIAKARVLVVEVDPGDPASMRRVGQVRAARADLPLIVAIPEANVGLVRTLIRQGVSDVATLPLDHAELTTQLLDLTVRSGERSDGHPLASLATLIRSTGGCGTTTLATHLAAALANGGDRSRVLLIDLDIQFGTIAALLGATPKVSISELIEAGDRLDAELFRSAAIESQHGFAIIAAPQSIMPLNTVDSDHLLRLLTLARREYDYVLLDLPANWTDWTLSAAVASTDLILLTDLSIAGLRQAKRRLDLFASVGIDIKNIRVVVNKVERRLFSPISVDQAEAALGLPVCARLSLEPALPTAQDQGRLVGELNRKSRFATDVAKLAVQLTNQRSLTS